MAAVQPDLGGRAVDMNVVSSDACRAEEAVSRQPTARRFILAKFGVKSHRTFPSDTLGFGLATSAAEGVFVFEDHALRRGQDTGAYPAQHSAILRGSERGLRRDLS